MTPFGLFLEKIRRSRQLQQKRLAAEVGIQASYVSSLEKGRKPPPSKKILEKLIDVLNLDEDEQLNMWECVKQSKRSLELPDGMMPSEYQFISKLSEKLGSLSEEQITLMMGILALNINKNKHLNSGRMNM
ncbi:MAG: helix-turn-helix domain-containing protein [Methylobacter sp.]|jgi:transcriptional regulator with XRE-family HTH domain|uniref:helix-turn-helix domain-containing protein n=1 Tax=Methylobacter sp. TaxID=2051955 RepID=UPI0025D0E797|nr:helix-turn-helix transcriptional regulator [Methylobacter sp.]MCK9621785.1 helix-turn-helix domain-containing protein [Methylobacter sp.]